MRRNIMCLSLQGFYLGKYEVTQAQYEAVMTGNQFKPTPSNWE